MRSAVYEDVVWTIRDVEAGELVALVRGGTVTLAEHIAEASGLGVFG